MIHIVYQALHVSTCKVFFLPILAISLSKYNASISNEVLFSVQKDINELLMVIFIRTTVCLYFVNSCSSQFGIYFPRPTIITIFVYIVFQVFRIWLFHCFYVHTIYSFTFGCEFIHEIK